MYALRILVYTSFLDENEEIPFLSDVKCFLNKAQVLLHSGAAMLKAAEMSYSAPRALLKYYFTTRASVFDVYYFAGGI